MSAFEEVLQAIIDGEDPATLLPPGSRGEVLLQAVLNKVRADGLVISGHTTQLAAKATKAASPTAGHIATLDANGNPIDSGHPQTDLIKISNDVLSVSTLSPWIVSVIQSGTFAMTLPAQKHPGVATYTSHASNGNSGVCLYIAMATLYLAGMEKSTFIFKTPASLTGVTRRMGLHNSNNSTAPSNGVYIAMIADVLTGRTATDASTYPDRRSITGSSYTISSNTWYRATIELNTDASLATFTLYADDSNTVLWTDTINTYIPKYPQYVGHADNCTLEAPSGATVIGCIDYVDVALPGQRRLI